VGLRRVLADDERRGDLRVGEAASHQPQDLELARRELVERGGRLRRSRAAGELLDQPRRHGGREERAAGDLKYEGLQCTLTAVLADGSITLQGASLGKRIPGASAPSQDVYAITGGTGAYVDVAGTMRRSGNGKTDTDVFELR
jgi:hypothetical protein